MIPCLLPLEVQRKASTKGVKALKWFLDEERSGYLEVKLLKTTLKVTAFVLACTVGGPVPVVLGTTALVIGAITQAHSELKEKSLATAAGFLAFTIVKETALTFIGLGVGATDIDAFKGANKAAVLIGDMCGWLKAQAKKLCGRSKPKKEKLIIEVSSDSEAYKTLATDRDAKKFVVPFEPAMSDMKADPKKPDSTLLKGLKTSAKTAVEEGKKYFKCK